MRSVVKDIWSTFSGAPHSSSTSSAAPGDESRSSRRRGRSSKRVKRASPATTAAGTAAAAISSRLYPDASYSAVFSNRSSPETSPERAALTSANSARPENELNLTRTLTPTLYSRRGQSQPKTRRRSSRMERPVVVPRPAAVPSVSVVPDTPATEKMAYFGSNESEREASNNDEDGDLSSSEDSAAENDLLDSALGLQSQQEQRQQQERQRLWQDAQHQSTIPFVPLVAEGLDGGDDTDRAETPPVYPSMLVTEPDEMVYNAPAPLRAGNNVPAARRDMLVQRPIQEQPHFRSSWEDWEHALLRPAKKVSAHQLRSSSPGPSSLAARRRGSPAAGVLTQEGIPSGLDAGVHEDGRVSPVPSSGPNTPGSGRGTPISPPALDARPPSPKQSRHQRWSIRRIPFRSDLLTEVTLLTVSLLIAAYRLQQFRTPFDAELKHKLTPIPLSPLVMLLVLIPCVALFRSRPVVSIGGPEHQAGRRSLVPGSTASSRGSARARHGDGPHGYYMFPFTDERGYRTPTSVDDGFAVGATIPVLLAAGFLWDMVRQGKRDDLSGGLSLGNKDTFGGIAKIMDVWHSAGLGPNHTDPTFYSNMPAGAVHRTIVIARISLMLSTSINSFILVLQLLLSRTLLRVDRLPTNNTKRLFGAMGVATLVSFTLWTLLALNHRFAWASPYITPSEAAVSSWIYQMSMYTISRLVRRGFTLGELSIATGSGISLSLEFWRITKARLFYAQLGGIPATFRMPTPLIPFHHVMIPGAFLTGFLLSPLLVLSRNFAQMPSHRLKWPQERGRNRKLVALGSFSGFVLIICLPFAGWVGWTLGGGLRTPWAWGLRYCALGADGSVSSLRSAIRLSSSSNAAGPAGWRRWKRILLALYWLAIVVSAVGGWQTRLVRARRIRVAKTKSGHGATAGTVQPPQASARDGSKGTLEPVVLQSGPQAGISAGIAGKAAIEMAGVQNIRENRRMHVALDLRRKFFHALAVVMFVPAIAIDPAFTSLAFSVAFAIFSFAEYARYFAIYPIGAPIHVFFSEFIDSKDAGPVILSHFYLLTGCAGGLWLEGKGIMNFTGVLAVGIGDAFASILGRRLGTTRWPGTNKTILGTAAFVVSIFGSAMLLRVTGVVEPFSAPRYLLATVLSGLLEAVSAQNDNLVVPIYFWSLLSLLEV